MGLSLNTQDKFIPVAVPDVSGNEETYVVEAIRSTWISSSGKFVDRFESVFAQMCGAQTALGVCNGTIALHLALLALDLRPGDEVLVPSLTYVATANAVRYVGAEPIFVEVDPATWCMDPAKVEDCITRRTKGIIVVHLYGHPADMDRINHIASVNGLWVVEDAAEAHLATYKGRPVGGLATMATFSFYGNKTFSSGEGGALTLNSDHYAKRLRTLRGQGMDPERRYFFPVIGYNFRLTNIACALLCAQLERAEALIKRRWEIYSTYRAQLEGLPGIGFQPVASWAKINPWLFCITVDPVLFGRTADELMNILASNRIDSRPFFIPIHTLPPYREQSRMRGYNLLVTERLASQGINLPTYTSLTDTDISRICTVISRVAK